MIFSFWDCRNTSMFFKMDKMITYASDSVGSRRLAANLITFELNQDVSQHFLLIRTPVQRHSFAPIN